MFLSLHSSKWPDVILSCISFRLHLKVCVRWWQVSVRELCLRTLAGFLLADVRNEGRSISVHKKDEKSQVF